MAYNVGISEDEYTFGYITPTVVGVYRDWPGSSALNLYI